MKCWKLILYNITFKAATTIYETTTMQEGYEYEESQEIQEESGELEEIKGETRIRKLKNKKKQKKQKNTKENLENKESAWFHIYLLIYTLQSRTG